MDTKQPTEIELTFRTFVPSPEAAVMLRRWYLLLEIWGHVWWHTHG